MLYGKRCMNDFKKKLIEIYNRVTPPEANSYHELLKNVNLQLGDDNMDIRPVDNNGMPGGLIFLKKDIPTIITPDLHARINYLITLLFHKFPDGVSVLDMLSADKLQIVCVGDGFHSETHPLRWKDALKEFENGFAKHKNMDDEMRDSMGVMEIVMELKCSFPDNFHFLKGNHENVANERGEGNFPFRKYAYEGAMVLEYFKKFYSEEILESYYNFEKKLPLFAVGVNFLISHAEPLTFYDKDTIINYRDNWDVVQGLTWTDNDAAEEGSVQEMLNHFIDEKYYDSSYYFGGHRPIKELFAFRADGRYIQLHNTKKYILTLISDDFDPEKDISELDDSSVEIMSILEKEIDS